MTESAAPVVLAALPYAERQLIVVVDDALVAAEREAQGKAEPGNGGASAVEIAKEAALAIAPESRWRAGRVRVARIAGLTGHMVASAVETALAAARARDSGVDVLTVASTEAASLTFPPGHPRDRVLYVGHPAVPTTYYAAAGFHRHTFEHMFAEAVELVMALGATQLEVEHVKGWSDELAANLAVPLPMAAGAEAGLHAEQSRSHGSSALFKATLKGNANPKLPDGLVWFPHEPTWQQLAEGRLKHGLTRFQLSVRYEDDYGIDAGLKLKAGKAGLDLGGSFQEHESTVWRIEGNFAE
jgi:hypothetical protein